MRLYQKLSCVFLTIVALTASSGALYAQRGGGFGRGMLYNRAQLASLAEVQAEIKFSDEQKKAATEIYQSYLSGVRDAFQNANGDFQGMMEKTTKLGNDASSKLIEKLDETQKSRLTQIYVQINKTNAILDSEVQKAVKISDDQAKKLQDAQTANREAMMSSFGSLRDASPEERQRTMDEMRKAADERLFACVSADQKAEFEKLGGPELKVDLEPLAPRRLGN